MLRDFSFELSPLFFTSRIIWNNLIHIIRSRCCVTIRLSYRYSRCCVTIRLSCRYSRCYVTIRLSCRHIVFHCRWFEIKKSLLCLEIQQTNCIPKQNSDKKNKMITRPRVNNSNQTQTFNTRNKKQNSDK